MGGIVAAANLVSISAICCSWTASRGAGISAADVLGGLAGGWFVAMLVGVLLPVFEHLFHVTTDIRLLELSNQNLPLLRTLALEAPGTYQHSLMLGHLAEAAAEAIGADALLARVAGYYHDIGKIRDARLLHREPAEGRQPPRPAGALDERARHRDRTSRRARSWARKARLPEPIVAAIREHHGTKLIRYFYQKALTSRIRRRAPVQEHGLPPLRPASPRRASTAS